MINPEPTPSPTPIFDLPLITQSLIAFILVLTTCYMMAASLAVPELLIGLDGLVVGYYFGTRQQASMMRDTANAINAASFAAHIR